MTDPLQHADQPAAQLDAGRAAQLIRRGYDRYESEFLAITRRAKTRFEQRDWLGVQHDSRERLELYATVTWSVVEELRTLLGEAIEDLSLWARMRDAYSEQIAGYGTIELGETFFNSVTRRIVGTVGVNPAIEFLDFTFERVPPPLGGIAYRVYVRQERTADAVRTILDDYAHATPYVDPDRDARLVAEQVERHWEAGMAPVPFEDIEILEPVFYRRKAAYLVGRVRGGNRIMPLAIALRNTERGIVVDAVVLTERDISVVFGFTRSYFHAAVRRVADVIQFLRSLMPYKPIAELYNALGHNKHGKTEAYRSLQRHLARTDERFGFAPGARGMVMVVFTLPSYDVVFKVIRDTFEQPKRTTRDRVKERYRLVFTHDRAGRLVDAQEFEHLVFARDRFGDDLLDELLHSASRSVHLEGDQVVIEHLYAERKVRPLDLYLSDADTAAAIRVALDYGQAIKDLAATNVFPGDLLLKNFGVTRHGRVIFYDYDELRLLGECKFREIPEARYPEDELADEPWYHVGPDDVFPEEFVRFLQLRGEIHDEFLAGHRELFSASFWQDMQDRNRRGEVIDVFPYREERRLLHQTDGSR